MFINWVQSRSLQKSLLFYSISFPICRAIVEGCIAVTWNEASGHRGSDTLGAAAFQQVLREEQQGSLLPGECSLAALLFSFAFFRCV